MSVWKYTSHAKAVTSHWRQEDAPPARETADKWVGDGERAGMDWTTMARLGA